MTDAGSRRLAATLIALFVAGLLLWLLGRVKEIVFLLFVAALLAVFISAVTDILVARIHMPRALGLTVALIATLGAAIGVVALVLPPVIGQGQDLVASLPEHATRFEAWLAGLVRQYPMLERTALGQGRGVIEAMINDATEFVRGSLVPYLTAGGKVAVELVAVMAMAIYLARNPSAYREGAISLVPPKHRHVARTTMADLADTMRTWIWAQLFAMLVLGVLTAVGLWLLQVPYALAFGVFAGVAAIVPFFGTIISTVLPALFVLPLNGVVHALLVVGLGAGVHLFEANVVAPLIFEERVSLPPVLTILSVLVMASLLGVLGLIVAVPTLAAVLVIVRHVVFGQMYGEGEPGRVPSAVLVASTGERKAIVVR